MNPMDRYKSFMDSQFSGSKKSIGEAKSLISEGNGFGGIAVGIHALKQVKWTDLGPLDLVGAFREQGGTIPAIEACAYLESSDSNSTDGNICYVVLVKTKADKYAAKVVCVSLNPRNVASGKSPVEMILGNTSTVMDEAADLASAIKVANKKFKVKMNK